MTVRWIIAIASGAVILAASMLAYIEMFLKVVGG